MNRPHATTARNYGRDGAMRGDGNGGRGPNYEPNSFSDAPKQSNEPVYAPLQIHGWTGSHQWQQHEADTDFAQAGDLYRLMDEAAKERLVNNIAGGLGAVRRQDIIDRSLSYFRQADADYGARLEKAIKAVQARIKGDDNSVQVGQPAHEASKS